jgi:hypothetical protein
LGRPLAVEQSVDLVVAEPVLLEHLSRNFHDPLKPGLLFRAGT